MCDAAATTTTDYTPVKKGTENDKNTFEIDIEGKEDTDSDSTNTETPSLFQHLANSIQEINYATVLIDVLVSIFEYIWWGIACLFSPIWWVLNCVGMNEEPQFLKDFKKWLGESECLHQAYRRLTCGEYREWKTLYFIVIFVIAAVGGASYGLYVVSNQPQSPLDQHTDWSKLTPQPCYEKIANSNKYKKIDCPPSPAPSQWQRPSTMYPTDASPAPSQWQRPSTMYPTDAPPVPYHLQLSLLDTEYQHLMDRPSLISIIRYILNLE